MSALFDFPSLLTVIILFICTCAYVRPRVKFLDNHKTGLSGVFWKAARIGERKSPWVGAACVCMAIHVLFIR